MNTYCLGKLRLFAGFPVFGEPGPGSFEGRLESPGASAGGDGDPAILANDKEPGGPRLVSRIHPVVKIINDAGDGDVFLLHHPLCHHASVAVIFVFVNAFLPGKTHRPIAVGGVCFSQVDDAKLSYIPVIPIHLFHFAQPSAKGRSGIASEEEYHRPLTPEARQIRINLSIEGHKLKGGRHFTDLGATTVSARSATFRSPGTALPS